MNDVIEIVALNISEKKGTVKHAIPVAEVSGTGLAGDAHAGPWNRQVSLLGIESIERFISESGRQVKSGEFAENITTKGIELKDVKPLDRFLNENLELEVTQIGKECHGTSCAIYREVGKCVMPKEGIFCRVVRPGKLSPGDVLRYQQKVYRTLVITLSDRASSGVYEDRSGPAIVSRMMDFFTSEGLPFETETALIPDDPGMLKGLLMKAGMESFDFIFTTGGTGIGPKDFTPEVVKSLIHKEIPGIMEAVRNKYVQDKPAVALSRSVAGVMGNALIYTLPGSLRAVDEYMSEILKTLIHAKYMIHSLDFHG